MPTGRAGNAEEDAAPDAEAQTGDAQEDAAPEVAREVEE